LKDPCVSIYRPKRVKKEEEEEEEEEEIKKMNR